MKKFWGFLMGLMLLVIAGAAMIQPAADSTMGKERTGSATVEKNVVYVSNAMATITVPADTFTIAVSVESANDNGSMASAENEAAMDKTINAMIAVGVDKSDILPGTDTGVSQSQSSNVVCDKVGNDTICKTEKYSKNVFTSTKYVKINTTDSSFVTNVLETAKSSGANAGVFDYGLSDKSSAVAEARQKAMGEAESTAKKIALQRVASLGMIQNAVNRGEYITYSDRPYMMNITSLMDVSYALI
jgi:uncharacterized protein YggE